MPSSTRPLPGPPPIARRRLLALPAALALPALALAALGGCAGFGAPSELVISEAELQDRVERQFPQQQRLLELFDVSLRAPRIRLLPDRGRLASALDLDLRERLGGRRLSGSVAFDSALRLEPSDMSLRLAQVRVDSVRLGGPAGDLSQLGGRVAAVLAETLLEDMTVWRATPAQLDRLRRAGLNSGRVDITPRGLELHFGHGPV